MDFYIDPARDFICVREAWYHRTGADADWKEVADKRVERSDFVQLPSGQWYAQTLRIGDSTAPAGHLRVQMRDGTSLPATRFDGRSILRDVLDADGVVDFY